MPKFRKYTQTEKQVALTYFQVLKDAGEAARKSNVEEAALLFWLGGGDENAPLTLTERDLDERPRPPKEMAGEERYPERVVAAPDLWEWVKWTFLSSDSRLYNEEHTHLLDAEVGFLWTNVAKAKQQRVVAGMAEIPLANVKEPWAQARGAAQLAEWFGQVPHFVITLDSVFAEAASDATFCALVEHELYHCAPALDKFGLPKFDKKTGEPKWAMRGHDAEEFVGIVRRYGPGPAAGGVAELVKAAQQTPLLEDDDIFLCCGSCR